MPVSGDGPLARWQASQFFLDRAIDICHMDSNILRSLLSGEHSGVRSESPKLSLETNRVLAKPVVYGVSKFQAAYSPQVKSVAAGVFPILEIRAA